MALQPTHVAIDSEDEEVRRCSDFSPERRFERRENQQNSEDRLSDTENDKYSKSGSVSQSHSNIKNEDQTENVPEDLSNKSKSSFLITDILSDKSVHHAKQFRKRCHQDSFGDIPSKVHKPYEIPTIERQFVMTKDEHLSESPLGSPTDDQSDGMYNHTRRSRIY